MRYVALYQKSQAGLDSTSIKLNSRSIIIQFTVSSLLKTAALQARVTCWLSDIVLGNSEID